MAIIGNVAGLQQALARGSHFAVRRDGKLETIGAFTNFFRKFASDASKMERNKNIMIAMSALVDSDPHANIMSGPVRMDVNLPGEFGPHITPYEALAGAKNRIAEMYVTEKLTVDTLIAKYDFSHDVAQRIRTCMLDNLKSGFLRPMLARCNNLTSIRQAVDRMVAGAKTAHGAFLMGLDPQNSFPKSWQYIKDTKLANLPGKDMEFLFKVSRDEFLDWAINGAGKTADSASMAAWVEESCQTLKAAVAACPRDHGYSTYPGSLGDKMRLARLFPNDQSALALALKSINSMRTWQPSGELTPANVWLGAFGGRLPEGVNEGNFSSKFSEKMDAYFMGDLQISDRTKENLSLMRRMIMEFELQTVVWIMLAANAGLPRMNVDNPNILVSNLDMLDAAATFAFAPDKDKTAAKSMLEDFPYRLPVMKPNREGTLEPHPPVIRIVNETNETEKTFTGGDTRYWGKSDAGIGTNGRGHTYENGPMDGKRRIALVNKGREDGNYLYAKGDYSPGHEFLYGSLITKAVGNACKGNSPKQFDAVMLLLSNKPMERMFGENGVLCGLNGVRFTEHTGVDMTVNREPDGSVRVSITSGEATAENGWSVSLSFLAAPDGSVLNPEFSLNRQPGIAQNKGADA